MLLAAAVLGERPSLIQVAGAVVVCSGVLWVSLAAPTQRDRLSGPSRAPSSENRTLATAGRLASAPADVPSP